MVEGPPRGWDAMGCCCPYTYGPELPCLAGRPGGPGGPGRQAGRRGGQAGRQAGRPNNPPQPVNQPATHLCDDDIARPHDLWGHAADDGLLGGHGQLLKQEIALKSLDCREGDAGRCREGQRNSDRVLARAGASERHAAHCTASTGSSGMQHQQQRQHRRAGRPQPAAPMAGTVEAQSCCTRRLSRDATHQSGALRILSWEPLGSQWLQRW